jgi:histone H3/H4
MEKYINGGITIIAVLVYVVIFFIQKAQMNSQKGIISSMKTFMEIFDVEQVRKFAEMKEETTLDKATRLIIEKPQIQKIQRDLMEQMKMPVQEFYRKVLTDINNELMNVAFITAMNQKKELRDKFIEEYLPLNKEIIIGMISDSEKK